MMRRNVYLLVFLSLVIFTGSAKAQADFTMPVKWSFSIEKINESEVWLVFTAKIDKGWHVYSQAAIPEGGPFPASFTFTPSASYKTVGETKEVSPVINEYDKTFEMKLSYFENKAVFKQKIKITTGQSFTLKGELEYMVCSDDTCLPPTVEDFAFTLQGPKSSVKLVPVK